METVISCSTIIKNKIDISKYDEISKFHEGLSAVSLNGKWGYINKEGKEIIKPIYDEIDDFQDDLIVVKSYRKRKYRVIYDVIDKEGNQIIDNCTFDSISISDGMIIFDNKYMVEIKTMELAYLFKLSLNNKTIEKEFNDKNKRDRYIKEIEKYLKEMETEKEKQITKIENFYVDNALEKVNSYYKKYQ